MVVFIAFPVFIVRTVALGFPRGTRSPLVDMSFTSFIVSCSLVGSPVMEQPLSENGSFTGVSYKEGNKWNRNATREKTEKNMATCAYNTGYYEWLCVRMTMRIMQ